MCHGVGESIMLWKKVIFCRYAWIGVRHEKSFASPILGQFGKSFIKD